MATDERNFRSSYYEKVGCNSVEENRSLNILFNDPTLNRLKLQQFCLRFAVPATQRKLVWSIILGVLPVNQKAREYVMEQRTAVYDDALKAVQIMRYIDDKTPTSQAFYSMWLLENRKLNMENGTNENNHFVKIANVLLEVFENDIKVVYWIAKEFYELTKGIKAELPKLKELTQTMLKKEDTVLYKQLESIQFFSGNLIDEWYGTCFAGVIKEVELVKVWDKICGGSRQILVFILVDLLRKYCYSIFEKDGKEDLKKSIEQLRHHTDHSIILNKAIKTWTSCNTNHNEITTL